MKVKVLTRYFDKDLNKFVENEIVDIAQSKIDTFKSKNIEFETVKPETKRTRKTKE